MYWSLNRKDISDIPDRGIGIFTVTSHTKDTRSLNYWFVYLTEGSFLCWRHRSSFGVNYTPLQTSEYHTRHHSSITSGLWGRETNTDFCWKWGMFHPYLCSMTSAKKFNHWFLLTGGVGNKGKGSPKGIGRGKRQILFMILFIFLDFYYAVCLKIHWIWSFIQTNLTNLRLKLKEKCQRLKAITEKVSRIKT